MKTELEMKIHLVALLMQTHPKATLASEVRYSFGARRADVVMLEEGRVHAFEIKSARDSTQRLGYQIEPENLERIHSELRDDIGLWCVTEGGKVIEKRQAAKQMALDPFVLASVLPVRKLRSLVKAFF